MNLPKQIPAFIYCRAASTTLANPNEAIVSQEARCRAYAEECGFSVENVFSDIGMKDPSLRPAWHKMLGCLRDKPDGCVVLADDITRLGRAVAAYAVALAELRAAGGTFKTPSAPFDDTPEGRLIENMMMLAAECIAADADDGSGPKNPKVRLRRKSVDQ